MTAPARSPAGNAARHAPGLRTLLALVFLACFCWQTCLAQAHFHWRGPAPATAASNAPMPIASAAERPPVRPDPADKCPLCRELIHAAYGLPGTPPILSIPVAASPLSPEAPAALAAIVLRPFLAWYSRGPPAQPLTR